MKKTILSMFLLAAACFGQYTAAPAGAPPSDLNPAVSALLQKEGVKISNGSNVFCEIWFRSALPAGAKSAEEAVTLPNIAQGTLLGVIRFPSNAADRRGNTIKPGVYTLRYSNYPQNGDHQGVAPQRDFALISRAADDTDPNAAPSFNKLVEQSEKALGAPHPGVFSIWKSDASAKPGLTQQGDTDWVLQTKIGDVPIAMIVVGKTEH